VHTHKHGETRFIEGGGWVWKDVFKIKSDNHINERVCVKQIQKEHGVRKTQHQQSGGRRKEEAGEAKGQR
jgi:hypothetical protein